jgi:NAD(P)-dependent dehydrogenase (short-subunit alcohol dehydrogenase family)
MTHSPILHLLLYLALLNMVIALSTTGQVALVTGANKGIGKEICRLLAKDPSVSVTILACRSLDRGLETLRELQADGCENVYCVEYDLYKPDTASAVYDYVESNFGRLDVLINNAAICFNDPSLYGKVPYTPFEQQASITIQTNFFGTWKLTQALLPLLQKSTAPAKLINMASYAGRLAILKSDHLVQKFTDPQLTMPQLESLVHDFVAAVERGTHTQEGWPNTCYGLSKLAIISMTRVLARDYPSIVCSSVDPGYCATDQNNHQGNRPASRGAVTPYWLATTTASTRSDDDNDNTATTGMHWFDETVIEW